MDRALNRLLAERSRQVSRFSKWWSLLASGVLHAGLITAPILVPLVAATPPEPIEFVPVQIVPIQALGIEEPTSTPPPPPPDPEPPEPEPEPEVLPVPEKKSSKQKPRIESERKPPARPPEPGRAQPPARRQGSPRGSSLGTSTFGASVGLLDNPDFLYSYYVDQMLSMISANWLRPTLGGEIEAMLHFRIHRDGRITELRVVRSSGYNSFDLAGLRAVQSAAPFPRLPQTYSHDSLGVNLILR